jgi:para-aminobenzoate synthetase/4-amino-4-deoxychorismate lyase
MDSALPPHGTAFSLLETMRLEHGRVDRVERHLTRMRDAARYFKYPWDESAVRDALSAVAGRHLDGHWRVRLLVSSEGRPTIECTPHAQDARRWRIDFASEPVDARNPFVLHKTTHRLVYDAARSSRTDVEDVLLWNERGEVTESTIANVVAAIDGVRYTPPVSCGLLPGTFRAEQLELGTIRERVLSKADLASASRVWLINSLRGWVDAQLVAAPQDSLEMEV